MARRPVSRPTVAMASIATAVAGTAVVRPPLLAGLLGLPAAQLTPTAALALRLFAARNLAVSALAVRGDATAQAMFLPLQALDQLAWWDLYRRGVLPRRATATCAAISAAIIALGLNERASRPDRPAYG